MSPITASNVLKVKESYNKHLEALLESGVDEEEAKEQAQMLSLTEYEELNSYLGLYASEEEISIRKVISYQDLTTLPSYRSKKGELSTEDMNALLWEIGIDSVLGWWERIGNHRKMSGKVVYDKYIVGQERTDKEWITLTVLGKNVASLEAQVLGSGNEGLMSELQKMQGGSNWVGDARGISAEKKLKKGDK